MSCAATLSPALQQLVDSRLDSIERVLLSTEISRVERREIVQSVEDQIYELLTRRDEAEPTRDSVLALLATMDPPEAYFVAEGTGAENKPLRGTRDACARISAATTCRMTPLAVISCILGMTSLFSLVLWPISALTGVAAAICGSIALTQIHYAHHLKGVWLSIVGVCAPAMAMLTFFVVVNL